MTDEPEAMRPEDPMRLSGAIWCKRHEQWECSRRRKDGNPCHEAAIRGTDVGRMHAGEKSSVVKAKGEANLLAWSLQAAGEVEEPINSHDRMLALIRVTAARCEIYATVLRGLYQAEGVGGLVGATWAAGRSGEAVQTGEQIRGLVKLEAGERDKLARYLEVAHRMGIDTRQIEILEEQVEITMAGLMAGFAAVPSLLPVDKDAFLRAFLTTIGMGEAVPELPAGSEAS